MEYGGGVDAICKWYPSNNPQRLGKGTGKFRNQKTSGDHQNYSIIQVDQNTEKSPGNLLSLRFL